MSLVKVAFLNNLRRLSRTFLALLGIAIGITALISLVSVVDGVYHQANDILGSIQGITVTQKGFYSPDFSRLDISWQNKLESISGVKKAIPETYVYVTKLDNKSINVMSPKNSTTLYVAPKADLKDGSYATTLENLVKGRLISNTDKYTVLISKKFAQDHSKTLNSTININNKRFNVVGIFEPESSFLDNLLVVDRQDAINAFNLDSKPVNSFLVVPVNPSQSKSLAKVIEFKYHDLSAQTSQEESQRVGDLLGNLRLLVIVVSIIAAIVAGVGIINTMLMSVMERTKEIGTLKAVGWTNTNVMSMIVLESIFISVIGGIVGVVLGYLVSFILTTVAGVPTIITTATIIESFVFALFMGIIGGLYPAYVASKLNPIDALIAE